MDHIKHGIVIACEVCKMIKHPVMALALVRTWFNAWSTSFRMNGEDKTCIYGCHEKPDKLLHYITCPVLINEVYHLLPLIRRDRQLPAEYMALQMLVIDPDPTRQHIVDNLIRLTTVVEAYHNSKHLNHEQAGLYIKVAYKRILVTISPTLPSSSLFAFTRRLGDMSPSSQHISTSVPVCP